MDEQIRTIQEYVYSKYIDGMRVDPIDEEAACERLQTYFLRPDKNEDPECVYVGVLCFELGYEVEAKQVDYFQRAHFWLTRHRGLTGEAWDAVDDRLLDLQEFFDQKEIEVDESPFSAEAEAEAALAPVEIREIEDHGRMMLIPGGGFLFGANKEHRSIPGFYIDKCPVTNRQYEAFCRATGYRFPRHFNDKRFSHPDAPVVGVSVNDALKYSRWVGKVLPTEEQWEKACRGVDGRPMPWGDDGVDETRACFGKDPQEGGTESVKVRPKSESPYGVWDMIGNVWEWTSSVEQDPDTVHAIRGGCYNDVSDFLSATCRLVAAPKDKFEAIGFRCAKPT